MNHDTLRWEDDGGSVIPSVFADTVDAVGVLVQHNTIGPKDSTTTKENK